MCEQMLDGHALFVGTLKRRHIALDGSVEVELAFVHQHHRRGRQADDLGEGREIVDRFRRHRAAIVRAVVADGGEEYDAVAKTHREHRTRKRAVHLRLEIGNDRIEPAVRLLLRRDRRNWWSMRTRGDDQRAADRDRAADHGMMTRAGGFTGGSVESATTRPAPSEYAGGTRIGCLLLIRGPP